MNPWFSYCTTKTSGAFDVRDVVRWYRQEHDSYRVVFQDGGSMILDYITLQTFEEFHRKVISGEEERDSKLERLLATPEEEAKAIKTLVLDVLTEVLHADIGTPSAISWTNLQRSINVVRERMNPENG